MSREDMISKIRQNLTTRRNALRKALAGDLSFLRQLRVQTVGDTVDQALDSIKDEVCSQLAEVESHELDWIESALERMENGQYGICQDCRCNIQMARLQALLYATRCLECQQEEEKRLPAIPIGKEEVEE